jgi:hypothetical protein
MRGDEQSWLGSGAEIPTTLAYALAALVLALKAPDALSRPQFWAEDATVFFAQQHGRLWPLLFESYAGYLLVIPRLVAWLASPFSAVLAPLLYNFAALAVGTAAIASLSEIRALGIAFPFLLAAIALTPTNGEVFGTLTNVQWLTQFYFVSVVARCWQGEPTRHPIARAAVMLFIGLTGPLCIFMTIAFAVAWAFRAATGGSRLPSVEIGVMAACALVQALFIFRLAPVSASAWSWPEIYRLYASLQAHIFGGVVFGERTFSLVLCMLVLLAFWRVRALAAGPIVLFVILLYAALALIAVGATFSTNPVRLLSLEYGDRYYVFAKALFWWLVALSAIGVLGRVREAPALVLIALLGSNAVWMGNHLQRTALRDLAWPVAGAMIDGGRPIRAPINPPGWTLTIPAPER